MTKYKHRLERLEKKAGVKKKAVIMAIVRMKKVVEAYRTDPDGTKKDLDLLKGLSLEELHKSLEQFKETDDVCILDSQFCFGNKERKEADSHEFNFDDEPFPEKGKSLPEIEKEEKPLEEWSDKELDAEIKRTQKDLDQLTDEELENAIERRQP